MMGRWLWIAEKATKIAERDFRRTHWLSLLGSTAGAYLFFFYAGVFLELQKPSPMIVFIS
jgi:hypothetical protein